MNTQSSIGSAIRTLSNLLRRQFACPATKPDEHHRHCSQTSGLIMCYLCERPKEELCQHDVEQAFCIRRSTASRFLTMLEEDGLIERQSSPRDARRKLIVPTQKALSIHAKILKRREEMESRITEGLSEGEIKTFLTIAHKIETNLSR